MTVIASPRHDEHVHTRSLALAMAAAAQRQRARTHSWHPPPRPSPPLAPVPDPPPEPQTSRPCLEALRTSALAQQREAIELRKAAQEMWAGDQEMRLRMAGLAARMARSVRTHRPRAASHEYVADETNENRQDGP
jgi:hypothetical protein